MAARPFSCRKISSEIVVRYFKPRGVPLCDLEKVLLSPDELESLRLADYDCLYQAAAAEKMDISRQTFGNIINAAHKKIADALLNGKAICIDGKLLREFTCPSCGYRWNSEMINSEQCPECDNKDPIHETEHKSQLKYKPIYSCRKKESLND